MRELVLKTAGVMVSAWLGAVLSWLLIAWIGGRGFPPLQWVHLKTYVGGGVACAMIAGVAYFLSRYLLRLDERVAAVVVLILFVSIIAFLRGFVVSK